MITYRSLKTAASVYRGYALLASSDHYERRRCATVASAAQWYGTDDRVYRYEDLRGAYEVTDRAAYWALAVLLAIAPVGGRTYLGVPLRTAVAGAFAAFAIGGAIALAIPATCDDGERCLTEAEYADVLADLDAIRSERSGGRFDVLAACAITNGAELTEDACADYLRTNARLTAACGHLREQSAYEDCEAATLAEGS